MYYVGVHAYLDQATTQVVVWSRDTTRRSHRGYFYTGKAKGQVDPRHRVSTAFTRKSNQFAYW